MPRGVLEVNILVCFCYDCFLSTTALFIWPCSCGGGHLRDLCCCGGSHAPGKCSSLGAPKPLCWDAECRGSKEVNCSMETSSTVLSASLNPTNLPSPHYVHCSPHGLHECNCRETGVHFVVKVFLCNKSSGVKKKGRRKTSFFGKFLIQCHPVLLVVPC